MKRNVTKKLTAVALAAAMALAATGCGNNSGDTPSVSSEAPKGSSGAPESSASTPESEANGGVIRLRRSQSRIPSPGGLTTV